MIKSELITEILEIVDKVEIGPIYDDYAEVEYFDGVDTGASAMKYAIMGAIEKMRYE